MEIRIQSIHFDATEKLQEFIEKKVSKLEKFSEEIRKVEVTLKVVKPETSQNKEASIKISIPKYEAPFSSKIGDSFEEAIDECVSALEKQLIKIKEKSKAK